MSQPTLHVESEPDADVPEWAQHQRALLDETADAIEPFLDRYLTDEGHAMWPPRDDFEGIDALDDLYEGFYDWPLLYALGADGTLFDEALDTFEAITEQFADVSTGLGHPQVVDEFQQGYDWFHNGEGYVLFYHLCLAAPRNDRLRSLARKYAGFYLNESDTPDVYDFEHDLIKCPMNGSMGPAYHCFSEDVPPPMCHAHAESRIPWGYEEWKEGYGLPFYDLDGIDAVSDLRDPEKARRMGEALRDRCSHADVPLNLATTGLVTNAYLMTGDEKYRAWVSDYVAAWADRAEQCEGPVPDNVGHSGEIGETIDDKWYGGYYGWTWPHGWGSIGDALAIGSRTAALLDGDSDRLDLLRDAYDDVLSRGRETDDGFEHPTRYADAGEYPREHGQDPDADAGWFDYGTVGRYGELTAVSAWFCSRSADDRERVDRLRPAPSGGELSPSSGKGRRGGHTYDWLAYLDGEYPTYPERIHRLNREEVADRVTFMREDDEPPSEYGDWYLQERDPVHSEALVHCTLGAPHGNYYGGLPAAHVRHFDPDRERPGLPPGVAALVESIDPDDTRVTFVNTAGEPRRVTTQAGAFAQHRIARATVPTGDAVGDTRSADVALPPEGSATVRLETERHAYRPTYAFPWHDR